MSYKSTIANFVALLAGHFMPPLFLDWCSVEVLKYFVECIELGNVLHDNRSLTNVDESLFILPDLENDLTTKFMLPMLF